MGARSSVYERVEERHGHRFIRLKSGRLLSFWDAHREAERVRTALGTACARMFKLVGNDEFDLERLEWFIDDLESYVGHLRQELEKRRVRRSQEERIAALRNTTGRTPEEAAEFHRKAVELERRLESAGGR